MSGCFFVRLVGVCTLVCLDMVARAFRSCFLSCSSLYYSLVPFTGLTGQMTVKIFFPVALEKSDGGAGVRSK
jgi:hypothetical protein